MSLLQALKLRLGLFCNEYDVWSKLSFYSTVIIIAELTPWIVSLMFIGRVSSLQLAALSLVEMWIYSFLEVSWIAITQAASVLITQADGAGSERAKFGWLAMSMATMTFSSTIVSLLSLCSAWTLRKFTTDHELVDTGAYYASLITPAIFFSSYQEIIATYLIATGQAVYPTLCAFIFCFLDIIITYVFMFGCFGVKAPFNNALLANAMAWNVSSFLSLCLISIFLFRTISESKNEIVTLHEESFELVIQNHEESLSLLPINENHHHSIIEWLKTLKTWKAFGSLLLPSLVSAFAERMIFFALAFLVAKLGRVQIAAHNTCLAIMEYAFCFVVGMAEATSVRIGYYVGRGEGTKCMSIVWISISNSLIFGVIVAFVCSYYSRQIAETFTNDEEIILYIMQVSPLLWASFAIFAVGDQMLAILEGQGRGTVQMMSSFVGLLVVTLPLSFWLFYEEEGGIREIWSALLMGYIVNEVVATIFVFYSDWVSICDRAKEHITLE